MPTVNHCTECNKDYPSDVLVCPDCHAILIAPSRRRRMPTPAWLITLLVTIIILLFIFACYLAWQKLILHKY